MKKIIKFSVKFILYLLIFSNVSFSVYCQNYYYQLKYGIDENTFEWGWNGYMKTIWTSGASTLNDVISPVQSIPFSWNFYGKAVTQYKISDNGYITFDTSVSQSYTPNGNLPSSLSPNMAIYGFWRDFEITAGLYDHVVTWTYGTAPNRVHCIEWQSLSTKGNTTQLNATYFAIRLYEGGDFDIVHIWGRYNGVDMAGGTVGVENQDGSLGTMTSNSPNEKMKMPVVLPENMAVYSFIYGTQPNFDMAGLNLTVPEIAKSGTNVNIQGQLINYGIQTLNSFDLNYTIDNGSVITQSITGQALTNNGKYTFTHNIPWIASGTGAIHQIKVWADNLNGNTDNNHLNDTAASVIFVNQGIAASKKVLLEEFSTAPCGYCVDGIFIAQTILNTYPNAVGVTHHAGYLTDSMTIPESKTYEDILGTGAPMAAIDRIWWPGEARIVVSRANNGWTNKVINQLAEITPVNIAIETTYSSISRKLDITATANFVDYPYPGDLRINIFIIEDSVTGQGAGYDQTNYYSKDAPSGPAGSSSHPFYNLPYKIQGFVHRHVIRAVPGNTWGTSGIIPSKPVLNQPYSQSYSYIIPSKFKLKDLSVIAFVSYFDPEYKKLKVLNVQEKHNIATSIPEVHTQSLNGILIYPNPAENHAILSFYLAKQSEIDIQVINTLGQMVKKVNGIYSDGEQYIHIDVSDLETGIYYLKLSASGHNVEGRTLIIR